MFFRRGTLAHLAGLRLNLSVSKLPPSLRLALVSLTASPSPDMTNPPPLTNHTPTATGHLRCQTSPSASSEYITVHFRCGCLVFLVSGTSASMRQRRWRCGRLKANLLVSQNQDYNEKWRRNDEWESSKRRE